MSTCTIALFGEAEKGEYSSPHFCENLNQLMDTLGNPPDESLGLFYAIQSLMFQHPLIFFRVRDEGFSLNDYWDGLQVLETNLITPRLSAVCMPGVGNSEVVEAFSNLCSTYHSVLIFNEKDLYDFLTDHL